MRNTVLLFLIFITLQSLGQKSELNISIDERIETIYSIAFLSDYFLISNHHNLYKTKLKENLKSLTNHKAVILFDSLSKKHEFSFYKVTDWALQFDKFPELNMVREVSEPYLFVKAENDHLLKEFKKEFISFNQDSLFQQYLTEIKPLNKKIIRQVNESESIQELPTYLEEYYGTKLGSYNLILSPLLHSGGFNAEFLENGKTEVYALIGPNGEIDHIPYFGKDFLEMDLILHEFGHSFVNPLIEKYDSEVEKLKHKYYNEELKKNAKNQGYGEWKYVFNELLLRAITIQITEKAFGIDEAKKLLEYEKSIGFTEVENIILILKKYEQNRDKYTGFDKFYPILIEQMK